ncbi:uncharacterized protein LOC124369913 [Homalodisca vitripennis]|uniref:uncharacterized protein LOC124369913 n=1 Tax=Homalodisca vitripennis TaxID=197043 RepID=UPI001EEC149A|nr:uncharacterized protein LOC124369913 [Homalodisca vitripennis]
MDYMLHPSSEYQSPFGFRLQPRDRETCGSSKDSVASYKQRIDSMFDETYSVRSGHKKHKESRRTRSVIDGEDASKLMIENDNKLLIKNMVQARIEKMFAEVEGDGEDKPQRSKVDPSTFRVDYLGSLPLIKKVSSLEGLQEPLKDLYLSYKQMGNIKPVFQDVLEISNCGLRVKYLDEKQDELVEQLNPFPTIAVWAAVKFVCRPRGLHHGKEFGLEYAFMPLISDPESVDKVTLFRKLTPNEACYFTGEYYSDHSPLFVAVMRKLGVSRQLECHGFVCNSNENAIVIAANLYKALVITMAKNQSSEENCKKRNLKQKNGLNTVCSVGGSSLADDFETLSIVKSDTIPPKLPPANPKKEFGPSVSTKINTAQNIRTKIPPPRPPRKGKSSPVRSPHDAVVLHVKHPDPDEILQLPSPPSQSPQFLKSNSFNFTNASKNDDQTVFNKSSTHYDSERNSNTRETRKINHRNHNFLGKYSSFCTKESSDRGDILTKVAIPRSHSFLNANGPLSSRYNRHASAGPLVGNAIQRKNSIGSPLGLNELFTEFRLQEGLNNMEDILNAIIDPDGMSFNDLKPIYKEFLLKLAVTLTKDEMYQRSKSIMQRQKNRKKKITRRKSWRLKGTFAAGGLRRAIRRSLLKFNLKRSKPKVFEFSSALFPSCKKFRGKKPLHKTTTYLKSYGFPYSSSSNDSSLLIQNQRKSFQVQQQKGSFSPVSVLPTDPKATTSVSPSQTKFQGKELKVGTNNISEDSALFSSMMCDKNGKSAPQNKKKIHGSDNCLHQASSGYFSCSDCSYDSESCTCTSADKCYCSMGKEGQANQSAEQEEKNVSLTSCECDTDSCFESEKCYCNQKRKPSLFEQLKQQGFAASESSLSRANSPNTAWQKNEAGISKDKGKGPRRNKEQLQSSKSLEFLQVRPRRSSTSQLPLESKYHKSNNIYQSPVEVLESEFKKDRHIKSSVSSSPMTSSSESKSNKSLSSQRRSYSSDNLALDYKMFSTNSKSDDETPHEEQDVQQRKVLVVSTRDPKGRVIYMSAAQRNNSPVRVYNSKRDSTSDALSVKKSAEIAALFSNVKFNHRSGSSISSTKDEVIYNTLEPPDYFLVRGSSSSYMKSSSLENSLGYFP